MSVLSHWFTCDQADWRWSASQHLHECLYSLHFVSSFLERICGSGCLNDATSHPIVIPIDTPVHKTPRFEADSGMVPWTRVEKFVGQLSHDLRNGLNACELQLTFLAEISTDPDAVTEVKGLRTTLNGITKQLQSIRVATGAVKAHTLEYPATDLFEDLQERFSRVHPEAACRIEWKSEASTQTLVRLDPDVTLSAALELLNNALHFADVGTPLVARLKERNKQVLLCVEESLDTMPDSPEDWGRSPLKSTRRGAYGLGLFRARRSLEAQGSQLDFHYQPEQKRLVATITLPAAV